MRQYSITINGEPFISERIGKQFRCAFDISISPGQVLSTADIRIYGLSDTTAGKALKRGSTIVFRAGYESNFDVIFRGNIVNTFKERDGASVLTRMLCRGGQTADNRGMVNASMGKDASIIDILTVIAKSIPASLIIDEESFSDVAPYANGYQMCGDPVNYLNTLSNAHQFSYVLSNGSLVINREGKTRKGKAMEISRYTGMEGIPEIGGGESGITCDVSTRLNPKFQINGKFEIKAEYATYNTGNMTVVDLPDIKALGVYNILSIQHSGDSHTDNWSTRLSGLSENATTITPNDNPNALLYGKAEGVDQAFRDKVRSICRQLNMQPDWLMAIMAFETGRSFSPSEYNHAGSGAVGLIQFMPSTAAALGTSTQALARMTAVEQLDYVYKYFEPYKGRLKTLEDSYMAVLWPKAMGQPLTYVLWTSADPQYAQNSGFDKDHDGKITKSEACYPVYNEMNRGESYKL